MAKTAEKGPTLSEISLKYFGHKETHFEVAFVRTVFSIHFISFQKVGSFSKIKSLPKSRFSWLIKSIPELPRINTGKRTANKETSPAALIPKPVVSYSELRMTQDLCNGKVDITSFLEIPSLPKTDIRSLVNRKREKRRK